MNKAREESKMEKGYGIFKERKAGWCNAVFQLQSGILGFVLFCLVLVVFCVFCFDEYVFHLWNIKDKHL